MKYVLVICTFVNLLAFNTATIVNQCPGGNIPNLEKYVILGNCTKSPCSVKLDSRVPMKLKFTVGHPVEKLIIKVYFQFGSVNLPYLGVDDTDVCGKIYESDETTQADCKKYDKGRTYIYKDAINILGSYPKLKGLVHWGLNDPSTGQDVFCFEVGVHLID